MNKAVICIGSNLPDKREAMIANADDFLASTGTILSSSGTYDSTPEECPCEGVPVYPNEVLLFETAFDLPRLISDIKQWERLAGRSKESDTRCHIAIDIDVVCWNGDILRPTDFSRTYFRRGYAAINPLMEEAHHMYGGGQ